MKNFNKFFFSTMFVAGVAGARVPMNKIVGGVESDFSKHSYVVSLQTNGRHYCGGSLIASKFVLSAGHCVDGFTTSSIRVVIGSNTHTATATGAENHRVVKATKHPKFINSSKISYDYSILELDTASAYKPIALAEAFADPFDVSADGNSLTLGWGTTSESGSLATKLREVEVPLVTPEVCEESYPDQIDDTMVCAGLEEGGKDSCQGDSGGPLLVNDSSGKEILVGVVSWGEGCARPDKYGVYSDVAFVRDWIDSFLSLTPAIAEL